MYRTLFQVLGVYQELNSQKRPASMELSTFLQLCCQSSAHLERKSSFLEEWLNELSIFTFRMRNLRKNMVTAFKSCLEERVASFSLLPREELTLKSKCYRDGFGGLIKASRKLTLLCTFSVAGILLGLFTSVISFNPHNIRTSYSD